MKNLILLSCLLLGACSDAMSFRRGDAASGTVQTDQNDKCVIMISIPSYHSGPDVGLHARIISDECDK